MNTNDVRHWFSPVLCFEDDDSVRNSLVTVSRKSGIIIKAFATPEEAKAALDKNGFRAAILDIIDANARASGLDLARQFRHRHPWDYLEIVTGHDAVVHQERAKEIGVDRYACKPLKPTELINHLKYGILRKRLALIARKQHIDLDDLVAGFCREFGVPIPKDDYHLENAPCLAEFNVLLKEIAVTDDIPDPLYLAKLVDSAEKMWKESCRRQGPREQVALMLLKASRIIFREGPSAKKLDAMMRSANMLSSSSVADDDVDKVDDTLRTAGIDVLVQVTPDET